MTKKLISVVVPIYNESENIVELYNRIEAVLGKKTAYAYELIFIDDGSSDGSWDHIRKLARDNSCVRGICLSRNFGQQVALSAGLDAAEGEAIIMMDGDLQHPPEAITDLIAKWEEGYDVVYTIRKTNKAYNPLQKLISNCYYSIFRKMSGIDMPKGVVDFRLISKTVNEQLKGFQERTRFVRGLVNWVGFKSVAIDYSAEKRYKGISKYSFFKLLKLATTSIMSFSSFPLYISGILGLFVAFLSAVYIVYAVYVKFFSDYTVPGWTSILVSVLFLGGVQLIAIGILGGYIAKIYEEVKQRPLYIIRQTTGTKT